MAEPAWKLPTPEVEETSTLQRWVKRSDGRLELLELPLTPELYLDPEFDDKMVQGSWHSRTCIEIYARLAQHLASRPDVEVYFDLKHSFGPQLSAPAPDISVVPGSPDRNLMSFSLEEHGVVPSLVIEVVSPMSRRIRETDLTRKVKLYEKVGIAEYVIVDTPNRRNPRFHTLLGYRLDASRLYQPIPLDGEGRLLSESAGVRFQVSPIDERVLIFDSESGRRLLMLDELEKAVGAADARADAAEAENARLRAEIERLSASALK